MIARADVALDVPRVRQLSVGMRAYAEELAARLPRVAPDLHFTILDRATALDAREQISLPIALRKTRARLVHFLSLYAPLAGPRPYVITIHDLIHLRFPGFFKRSVGPYYRTIVRAVCARADRVITDDERTVADLEYFLGVRREKVRVIPLGVDDAFLAGGPPADWPRPYFLYVGNHREHKDLATLFRAWGNLDPSIAVDLLVTGDDDLDPAIHRAQRAHGVVRFLGTVDAEELARWYRGAVALVHPALCEGFGLPMLEAAVSGTPIIASDAAVPSLLRPFAQIFPARDAAMLERLLARSLENRPDGEPARRVAQFLTWDRCAERTAEVYREVLQQQEGV